MDIFHNRFRRWRLALACVVLAALLAGIVASGPNSWPGRLGQPLALGYPALVVRASQQIPWTKHCGACGIAVYWLVRGPLGALSDSSDLLTVYAAARCWLLGLNPYDIGDLVASARASGAVVNGLPVTADFFQRTPSVYLPPALALLSPVARLDWAQAKVAFLVLSLAAVLGLLLAVARLSSRLGLATGLFLLAFAPLQTALVKGQPTVLVCALIGASLATARPVLGGLALGVACCLKPQLGLGFLLLALCLGERKKLVVAVLTGLVLGLASITRLTAGASGALLRNLDAISSASGINSGSPLNPLRYQLLNVDTLLPQALYGSVAVALLYVAIAGVSLWALRASGERRLLIGLVAVATLLIGYHRVYDAMLLWLGIPALLLPWRPLPALLARAVYATFLVSGQTVAWSNGFVRQHAGDLLGFALLHHQTLACVLLWLIFVAGALRPGLLATRALPPLRT